MKKSYFLILLIIGSCSFKIKDDTLVKIINYHADVPMHGKTFCQTLDDAKTHGGRLCYYVYPYPQISAGALAISYAVQLENNGKIKEIYIALTKNSKNAGIHIGGFFDPLDSALIKIDEKNKHNAEVQYWDDYKAGKSTNMTDYFTSEMYDTGNIIERKDFTSDIDLIATAIRELKEEAGWDINRNDFLSNKISIVNQKQAFKNSQKNHFTGVAILPLGIVDNHGNLSVPDKNINFKNFKAPGYDDIDVIYLFPLSKINLERVEDQPIDVYTIPKYYADSLKLTVPQILDNALRKYNNISLEHAMSYNIERNLINGENIAKIFKNSQKSKKRKHR